MTSNRKHAGFTLLELLVVTAILAILGTLISQIMFGVLRSNNKNEILKDIKQNGDFTISVMSRMIQNAREIDFPQCTALGEVPGTAYSFSMRNPDGGVTTFMIDDSDEDIDRIASVSAQGRIDYLTSDSIRVTENSLVFSCLSIAGRPKVIGIVFTLQQLIESTQVDLSASQQFETTVQIRNR